MLELFINKELITALPNYFNVKVVVFSHKLALFCHIGVFCS